LVEFWRYLFSNNNLNMESEKLIETLRNGDYFIYAKPIDDIAGPLLLGLFGYLIIILGVSFPAFLFRNKVQKIGSFEGKNRAQFLQALGNPTNILQIDEQNKVLVWMRGYGNYLLKIKFDSNDIYAGTDTQLDQTQNGVKGLVYKLLSLIIK
jgi:hypothetical protein